MPSTLPESATCIRISFDSQNSAIRDRIDEHKDLKDHDRELFPNHGSNAVRDGRRTIASSASDKHTTLLPMLPCSVTSVLPHTSVSWSSGNSIAQASSAGFGSRRGGSKTHTHTHLPRPHTCTHTHTATDTAEVRSWKAGPTRHRTREPPLRWQPACAMRSDLHECHRAVRFA